jgi:hypothetical protein
MADKELEDELRDRETERERKGARERQCKKAQH